MSAPRRPGDRRVTFDAAARAAYLAARAGGATQKAAAAAVGVAPKTVRDARRNAAFRTADDAAAVRGRPARIDQLPHDASRYNHHGCRCPTCTKAATTARTELRDRTAQEAPVMPITAPPQESRNPFPLARAS